MNEPGGTEEPRIAGARRARSEVPHRIRRLVPNRLRRAAALALDATGIHPAWPEQWPEEGFVTYTSETPVAVTRALQRVKRRRAPGDYYEFGLFKGFTFWHAQQRAGKLGLDEMRFFGFDSFAGLPRPRGVDAESGEFREGQYAASQQEVRGHLDRHGVDWDRTFLVAGFYEPLLTPELRERLDMKPAALVLIDCDLYESTVPVLGFMAQLLQEGTIVLMDDWNCFGASDQMGERKAFGEFLREHQEWRAQPWFSFGWHGQAFLMRRTALRRQ